MACSTNVSNIRLEAAFVSWGRKNKDCITPVADVAGSLNDTYFEFSSPTVSYYVWYNVNSLGTDPALAGKTGIEVALATGAAASAVVTATVSAIETAGAAWATADSDGLSFDLECKVIGAVISATADTGSTGFAFVAKVVGLGGDLGRTSDGIEVSFETTSFEVKANQSGETLLDEIKTGNVLSCSMNLLEMTQARWSELVGEGLGDKLTPAGGTEFVGFGSSKDYVSMLDLAGELVLKPVNSSDNSRNFTFWKSLPKPSSVNFSGTDLQVMAVEFSAYVDETKDSKISLGGFGDQTQDLR